MPDDPEALSWIRVRRGSPTPEELAALLAVVGEAYVEEAAGATAEPRRRSRWRLSARGGRSPMRREQGWGGFSG